MLGVALCRIYSPRILQAALGLVTRAAICFEESRIEAYVGPADGFCSTLHVEHNSVHYIYPLTLV
jgi:hypothetical protein